MILKGTLGEIFSGIDRYATRAKGARMLASNFGGDTIAERMREATALRSSRPNLKKVIGHIILSHDPTLTDLSDEQWLVALEIARQEHDLRDAAYCAVLHVEKEHRHLHLYYVRCRPDGSLVSDSQSYRKNEAAARRIEQELGLPPPTPAPRETKVGDRQRSDNAARRGRRKQQTEGEVFMETTELSRLTFQAVATSSSTETFKNQLAAHGIEAEWSSNNSGLKLRPIGASTWLKASSVNRELSGSKIIAALQRNADLGLAAGQTSAAVIAVADDRAKVLTATRIDRNEALDDITASAGVASRAMPQLEADAVRAQAAAGPDPLQFLAPQEIAPVALDDAKLQSVQSPAPEEDKDADARSERAEAQAELSAQFRKLSAAQLIELRNAAKRPVDDAVVALAILERLLALALKILSFGAIKIATNVASALQERELVAQAADDEIARRHRSPGTAAERMRWLNDYQAAIGSRQVKISASRTAASLSKVQVAASGSSSVRERLIDRADALRAQAGKPTSRQMKAEVAECEAAVAVLMTEAGTPLARLRRLAASADWKKRMARAETLREQAQARLVRFLDAIEQDVAAREAAKAVKVAEAHKILKDEAEGLSIEIRDRVPALRIEIERDAMRERLRLVGGDTDDTSRMRG
ncbi:MAG: relaxase/mobilization nuclease domain-containing protein [Burkholderiales bacterium]